MRTVTRTVARRASAPVRAPIRRLVTHYATFFEDLIHAVKSELVEKIDALDTTVKTGNQSLSDQLAVQSANVRRLQGEVERLQMILDRQASTAAVDISDNNGAAATSSPS